nr:hypothetical protein [Streptomyces antimycoticus]
MGGAPATAIATRRPGSQTRLVYKFHSATWNLLANKAGAELLNDNVRQIGARSSPTPTTPWRRRCRSRWASPRWACRRT